MLLFMLFISSAEVPLNAVVCTCHIHGHGICSSRMSPFQRTHKCVIKLVSVTFLLFSFRSSALTMVHSQLQKI